MANERFDCIISNVRNGISVADIGCDHAYVSCKLVKLGISNRVYASDVRKGPLECAEANIAKCGYKNFIETHLRDGLDGGSSTLAVIFPRDAGKQCKQERK